MKNTVLCRIAAFLTLCILCAAVLPAVAGADPVSGARENGEYRIAAENSESFSALLELLVKAYEDPAPEDGQEIESCLEAIRTVRETDYEIAREIAGHWKKVYLDRDYPLRLYAGGERAEELEKNLMTDGRKHAFVVLGYALANGEMTKELKGRCKAAAAAARSFPDAVLVCSGGPTGGNNPEKHTEAGLMKEYLVKACGLDASRIYIDEKAMTTVDNAVNSFRILRRLGIETITVVTSDYHQKWGQAVYNAENALCRQQYGYSVEILENYCYAVDSVSQRYRDSAQIAAGQVASVLNIPRGRPTKDRN